MNGGEPAIQALLFGDERVSHRVSISTYRKSSVSPRLLALSNVVQHAPGSAQVSKIDPRILPLVLASFALGTDAFVMIGMLPVIAREMQVTVGVAGQLVTAFSLTYAL